MHPCLHVDEIVRLVAHELVAHKQHAAAVALACCCKSFEDPALGALWERQELLDPLLGFLPRDVLDEGRCITPERPKTTTEWTRLQKHARRMRKLAECGSLGMLLPDVLPVLQLCTINEPLFPNLKTLELWPVTGEFIPFIPSFLSPRTTTIAIAFIISDLPKPALASMITAFPALCPNLQDITLRRLPRDPMITAAVSGMFLASNRNTLRHFHVSSPLTEEAREVIHTLPDLRGLSVVIERDTPLPSLTLPNLTNLIVKYDYDSDWLRIFRGATFGKLEAVTFHSRSEQIGSFLEAFEKVALATSIQNTLSKFQLHTSRSWNPNYLALLPFTQLTHLVVRFSCDTGCSSTVDDDVVTSLAQTMPKLETLHLGNYPCGEILAGATVKGLVALAHHCQNLSALRIHFQVASLSAPPATGRAVPNAVSAALQRDCALRVLEVGGIPVAEGSVSTVAVILARIFPRIERVQCADGNWDNVTIM